MQAPHDSLPNEEESPLAQFDAEQLRVQQRVALAVAQGSCNSDGAPAGHAAVPTEFLMEDLKQQIALPSGNTRPHLYAQILWDKPRSVVVSILVAAALCSLWVAIDPGQKFSVDPDLFSPPDDVDLQNYYRLADLDDLRQCSAAECQIEKHDEANNERTRRSDAAARDESPGLLFVE